MKPRLQDPVDKTGSPESVYAAKYQWLLRWALHFCDGDREMAEDLVQDTFMRMLSSWATIRDQERPERFLYTYLKYGFLRLRNADRREALQPLDQDFDLLDMSAASTGPGLIEWQEEIRAVVDFLCWRKAAAKSASLLLFRFFHGMFPSEIMLIASMSRKAVDDSLASSKLEARTYVNQNASPRADTLRKKPVKTALFVAWPPRSVPSTEDMIQQLLQVIYASGDGDCLSYAALRDRYSKAPRTPIDCWLLSHIVSCARCLDIVEELLHLPPRGSRPLEDVLGYAPKTEARKTQSKAKPVSAAMRSIAGAKDRYRSALDQTPASIAIIVNGEAVASRDVSGSVSDLTVDLRARALTEMIEVVSGQAILLTVPVLSVPPDCAPVQRFSAKLAHGRSVVLTVDLNPFGVRVRVVYSDPSSLETLLSEPPSLETLRTRNEDEVLVVTPLSTGFAAWLRRLLQRPFAPWMKFALPVLGVAACAPMLLHLSKPDAAVVLARAIEASAKHPATGIQQQQVRITTRGVTLERTLRTDLAHKLRAKQAAAAPAEVKLRQALESAHVGWNDPLSPAGFTEWKEEHHDRSASSIERNGKLLIVTTKVSSGDVREESLTLNAETLHAVGRTVRFSDSTDVQIAELDYRILPLAESDPAWFEGVSPAPASTVLASPPALHIAAHKSGEQATPGELDLAELNVLLAFAELHADGQERLVIKRRAADILVEGLVASPERKSEIEKRLRQVPKTSTLINTFATLEASASAPALPSSVAVGESSSAASALEVYSRKLHLTPEQVRALHASLLEAAIELRRSATELSSLGSRFPADSLTVQTASLRTTLTHLYASRIKMASAREKQALGILGVAAVPSQRAAAEVTAAAAALRNAQLCLELISQQDPVLRPAESILQELAVAVAALDQTSGELVPVS